VNKNSFAVTKIAARDFTWDLDLTQEELVCLLELTAQVKATPAA